jgi:hypothetical protein
VVILFSLAAPGEPPKFLKYAFASTGRKLPAPPTVFRVASMRQLARAQDVILHFEPASIEALSPRKFAHPLGSLFRGRDLE